MANTQLATQAQEVEDRSIMVRFLSFFLVTPQVLRKKMQVETLIFFVLFLPVFFTYVEKSQPILRLAD